MISRNATNVILILMTVLPSLVGMIATAMLVLIHVRYREVRKPFTTLVISTAAGEVVHFLNSIFLEPVGIVQMTELTSSPTCKVAGCLIVSSHMFIGLSETALAVDRYLQVVHSKPLTFRQRLGAAVANLIITILTTTSYIVNDTFGGVHGLTCIVDMRRFSFRMNSVALLTMVIFYTVTLRCSLKLMFFLKRYQERDLSLGQRHHVRDNKDILRTILLQTIPAVFLQPLTIIMYMVDGVTASVPQWLKFTLTLCYYVTPTVNCVLLLFMIKPYRTAVIKMTARRVCPTTSVQSSMPLALADLTTHRV